MQATQAQSAHTTKIEYKVRSRTVYFVTRYEELSNGGSSMGHVGCEYSDMHKAHAVAYALARVEHERRGWPLGDERMQYPGAFPDHADLCSQPVPLDPETDDWLRTKQTEAATYRARALPVVG